MFIKTIITIIICDEDKEYTQNFIDYFYSQNLKNISIMGLSTLDELDQVIRTNKIDLLILSESYANNYAGNELVIVLTDKKVPYKCENYYVVSKYQQVDIIISNILEVIAEHVKGMEGKIVNNQNFTKVIGIYSPIQNYTQEFLAFSLAKVLSVSKKVLVINLRTSFGMKEILELDAKGNLSDFMYHFIQEKSNLELKLKSLITTFENIDYVATMNNVEDYKEIEKDTWIKLIEFLNIVEIYDIVIIVFSSYIKGFLEILEMINCIVSPVQSDFISKNVVNGYESYLKNCNKKCILEKTKFINIENNFSEYNSIHDIISMICSKYYNEINNMLEQYF